MNKTIKTMSVILLAFAFVLSTFAISPTLNADEVEVVSVEGAQTSTPQQVITPTIVGSMYSLNYKFDPQVKMDETGIRYVNLDNQTIYLTVATSKDVTDFKLLADIGLAKEDSTNKVVLPVEYVDTFVSVDSQTESESPNNNSNSNSKQVSNARLYVGGYIHTYIIKLDKSANEIKDLFGDSIDTEIFSVNINLIETYDETGQSRASATFGLMFNNKQVPKPATIEWIIPSNAYMKINGKLVGSADVGPYKMNAGNPLKIEAGYVASTELPTLIIFEEVSTSFEEIKNNNKVFFYPVLERIDELNVASGTGAISYEYTYSSQIYKNLKPNTNYKVTFKVYPDTKEEKISLKEYNFAYNNYVKSVSTVLSFSKAPSYSNRFILRDVFGTDNGNGWAYGTTEGPQSTKETKSVNTESTETTNNQTIMSSGQVKVVLTKEHKIEQMRPEKNEVVTAISEDDIIVDTASSGQEAAVYLNQNNLTRKIKSIDTALSEGQINSEDVYGDVQLVNVDDVPKYIFTVKEKNTLFGFIPFGTKKVEKIVDATENLE